MSDDPNLRLYRKPQAGADLVLGAGAPTPNNSPDLLFHVPAQPDANLEFAGDVAPPALPVVGRWQSRSAESKRLGWNARLSITATAEVYNEATESNWLAQLRLSDEWHVQAVKAELYGVATHDVNVHRGPARFSMMRWLPKAQHRIADTIDRIPAPTRLVPGRIVNWHTAGQMQQQQWVPVAQLPQYRHRHAGCWQQARALPFRVWQRQHQLPRFWYRQSDHWQEARAVPTFARSGFWYPPALHSAREFGWSVPVAMTQAVSHWYHLGNETVHYISTVWQQAGWPGPGRSVIPEPPGPDPEPELPPEATNADLDFWLRAHFDPNLEFVPVARHIIPVRRCYLITNQAFIVRSRDGMDIPATDLTIELDVDSWAWQFSATIPRLAVLSMLKNEQLVLHVNGHQWHGTMDSWQSSRAWNSQSATISGRSLSAELSPTHVLPGSVFEPAERSIIQLAEQALPENWLLDWQAEDWLIPGGIYSAHNQTPIDMVQTLAQAAGAYVRPHPTERRLSVLPRYPTAPWQWSTTPADVLIPPDIMTQVGSELVPGQGGNGIYVSGGDQGVTTLVKRTGTAGSALLPMITNPLITAVNGATALGISALAQHQPHSMDTLELPISADTGLILPGSMVVADGERGITRGLRVSASSQNRNLSVRQQITVERHS